MKKKFKGSKEIFEISQNIQNWIESRIYDCFQKEDGSFPNLEVQIKEDTCSKL